MDFSKYHFLFNPKQNKHAQTLLLCLYYAEEITSDMIKTMSKYLSIPQNSLYADLEELCKKDWLEEYYPDYRSFTAYRVASYHFFPFAVAALECQKKELEKMERMKLKRSDNATLLWKIAECIHRGEKDIASKVDIPFLGPYAYQYLLFLEEDCGMEGYALRFNDESFFDYISTRTNIIINGDSYSGQADFYRSLADQYYKLHPSYKSFLRDNVYNQIEVMRFLLTLQTKPLTLGIKHEYPLTAVEAIKALYKGDYEGALSLFENSLKLRNKHAKEKNIFNNPIFAFYLILAYKKCPSVKIQTKITQYLSKKIVQEDTRLQPSALLAQYLGNPDNIKDIQKRLDAIRKTRYPSVHALCNIIAGYYGLKTTPYKPVSPLLALEYGAVSGMNQEELEALEKQVGGKAIMPSFGRIEQWEGMLKEVELLLNSNLSGGAESADNQRSERIAYFLNRFSAYWGGHEVTVRLQTRLLNGSWGAGKKISMENFLSCQYACMDETDKQVATACKGLKTGSILLLETILPYLIGTNRLYGGTRAPYYPIEVIKVEPFVSISKDKKGLKIATNVPESAIASNTLMHYEIVNDGRIEMFNLTNIQKTLLKSLTQLPVIPREAEERLQPLLAMVGKYLEVHSELIEGGSSLENVKGDPAVHVKINPCSNGNYQLRFSVRPLPNGTQEFFPGTAPKVIYDECEGKRVQVTRHLSAERAFFKTLSDFCNEELETIALEDLSPTDRGGQSESLTLNPMQLLALTQWSQEQQEGYLLEWPEGKKIKVMNVSNARIDIRKSSDYQWFEAEGEVRYGNTDKLSIEALMVLIGDGRLSGNYLQIDDEHYLCLTDMLRKQITRLEAASMKQRNGLVISKFNIGMLADLLQSSQIEVTADDHLRELENRINESQHLQPRVPQALNAVLRDYQIEGFQWMIRLDHWGAGACLADDMGLGKTLQAIAFVLYKQDQGPSLVVCPASVVMNWRNELARFAPTLNVFVLNAESNRKEVIEQAAEGDVVLSTYGLLAFEDANLLQKQWNVVCLDEAHTIKNRNTRTSGSAMKLLSRSRIILTGTPVQNYLSELWNLMQFLNPGLLGSFEVFNKRFGADAEGQMKLLKRIVQPFVLRRTKTEVLAELPEKTDIVRFVQLSDHEMLVYETMRKLIKKELDMQTKVNVSVLAQITKLRQAACSMALVQEQWKGETSKIQELLLLIDEIISGGNKVLIFSQFTSFLDMVNQALEQKGVAYYYLNGSTPIAKRNEMVQAFQKGGKPVFVVSLKAGGLGLNLTGANYVIHLDPWWNPAIEQQATDRAYRIGQKQNVTVYHLIAAHTIEEKILRMHESKRKLSDAFLEGADTAKAISIADLKALCTQ